MTGLVQATLSDLAPAMAGREIEVKVGPLPQMRGDREMMQRVWMNLLDNAIKFTGHKASALIEVGSYPEAGNTVYFVKDNGAGFDMSYVDKLFGVFQRLHRRRIFPEPAPGSPSSNGSLAGMAAACGQKARWVRARRSISHCRRRSLRMV